MSDRYFIILKTGMPMKKMMLFVLFLISLLLACRQQSDSALQNGKQVVLRLEPSADNPRNSEGDFIRLKDGRILFVYTHFTEGSGDHAGAYLAGRFSEDDGKSWTKKDVVVLPNEGKMNIMSVSLLRLQSGKIALFYLRKNSEADCIPYMRISTDEARTWSEPVRCIDKVGYYVMNNDRVIQLPDGRLLLPVSLHNTPESNHFTGFGRVFTFYSDDQGRTWHQSQEVANPDNIVLQEPGLIALKDGRLMLFCRTTSGVQYFSFSKDRGESWSPVEPGNIKSPCSPASIERIPATGDLLLVWNNNYEPEEGGGGRRTPFNLAISKDEGKSWEKIKTIECDPMGWYCYTAIEFVGEHVLLGHCAGDRRKNNGLATTQITRLSLDWIYADATPEPYVARDSAGVVELACPVEGAEIRYTLDESLPGPSSPIYREPIRVKRSTMLYMRAFHPGMTPSGLVVATVGTDVLQDALDVRDSLSPGLAFKYYEGECASTAAIEKLSPIKSGVVPRFSLAECRRDTNFALTFSGYIDIPQDGVYTFYLLSNDGSTLYLDDTLLIDNDGPHGRYEMSNKIGLLAGKHRIAVKYFQLGGGKALRVFWQGPGFDRQEIPASVLKH